MFHVPSFGNQIHSMLLFFSIGFFVTFCNKKHCCTVPAKNPNGGGFHRHFHCPLGCGWILRRFNTFMKHLEGKCPVLVRRSKPSLKTAVDEAQQAADMLDATIAQSLGEESLGPSDDDTALWTATLLVQKDGVYVVRRPLGGGHGFPVHVMIRQKSSSAGALFILITLIDSWVWPMVNNNVAGLRVIWEFKYFRYPWQVYIVYLYMV